MSKLANRQPVLKPQDLLVLLALLSHGDGPVTLPELAGLTGLAACLAQARGLALMPLYPTVPDAALRNETLYAMLSLFDAIRAGQARERNAAHDLLVGYFA